MTSDAVKRLADKYMLGTADKLPPPGSRPRPTARPEAPAELPAGRVRWSAQRRRLFQRWGIAALYVAGPKAPIPRGIGDNRLGWPIRIGGTGKTFADTITRVMDSYSPYHWQGVWFRVWTPSPAHVRRLAYEVLNRLLPEDPEAPDGTVEAEIVRAVRWLRMVDAEQVRHRWIDVGEAPDFDPSVKDSAVEAELGLRPLPPEAPGEAVRERRFKIVRRKLERAIRGLAEELAIETWDDAGVLAALERMEREEAKREVGEG